MKKKMLKLWKHEWIGLQLVTLDQWSTGGQGAESGTPNGPMSGFQYDVVGIKLNQTKETIIFRPNVVHISGVHI